MGDVHMTCLGGIDDPRSLFQTIVIVVLAQPVGLDELIRKGVAGDGALAVPGVAVVIPQTVIVRTTGEEACA